MRFDGERIRLVDWESAFLNDRYVDLAVVANFFVEDEAKEEAYLKTYFGEPADEYRRARFFLMRQAVSMFYAALLFLEAARGRPVHRCEYDRTGFQGLSSRPDRGQSRHADRRGQGTVWNDPSAPGAVQHAHSALRRGCG